MAFVAIGENTDEMLGVVRLHADANYETGESAILLRSDLKKRGLGWKLMQYMISYARNEGLKRIEGQVLRENEVMLDMCRQLGFRPVRQSLMKTATRRHDGRTWRSQAIIALFWRTSSVNHPTA